MTDGPKVLKRWQLVLLAVFVPLVALWLSGPFIPVGGKVIRRGPSSQRAIALTFDDGPNPTYTPQVLEILGRYRVKGTFFVVGEKVEQHPDTARLIVEGGHQIASHSQAHSGFLPYLTPDRIVRDCRAAEKVIGNATGVEPRFYRAPHGRISPWMRWALRRQGLVLVGWDCSPTDWKNPGVQELVRRVVHAARPGGIILLHDGLASNDSANRSQLVQALPAIIEQLQAKGYQLVTVAQLLGEPPYR